MASIIDGRKNKKVQMIFNSSPKSNFPVNTSAPVASGTLSIGNVLSTTQGAWTNNPTTFYYQWQRNGSDIPGAVFSTYTVVNADLSTSVRCVVTAWNNSGVGSAPSNVLTAGGGTTSTVRLGVNNLSIGLYFGGDYEVDRIHGELITDNHTGSFVSTPVADRNALGWPSVAGRTYNIATTNPLIQETYVLKWDQTGVTVSNIAYDPAFGAPVLDAAAKTYTFTPYAWATSMGGGFRYTFTGTAPTFTLRPLADPGGVFTTNSVAKTSAVMGIGSSRMMKWTRVVENSGVIDFDGGGSIGYGVRFPTNSDSPAQLSDPILSSTVRNINNAADYSILDGVPMERQVAWATAIASPAWITMPFNADASYYTTAASLWASFASSTGKEVSVEMSNEVWLSGATPYWQTRNEALNRGRTAAPQPAPSGIGATSLCTVLPNCRLLATTNLSLTGAATVDGVAVVTGDRILVIGQTTASQNGVWIANTAGAWSRAVDAIALATVWFITAGTNANTSWVCRTSGTITLGTTAISITQFTNIDRYVERAAAAWKYFETAFTSAGVLSKLKRTLCWQNVDGGSSGFYFVAACALFGVTPDKFGVAPYYADNTDTGYTSASTPTAAQFDAASRATVSGIIGAAASWKTWLTGAFPSAEMAFYESGLTPSITDITTRQNIVRSSLTHDTQAYFYQEANRQLGNIDHCHFANVFPINNLSNFLWGDYEDYTQTYSGAPRALAAHEFAAGQVTLQPLTYSAQSVTVSASDGNFTGTAPTFTTAGTVYSIASSTATAGAFGIDSTTGRLKVLDHTLLSVGSYNITVNQANPNAITNNIQTVVPMTVAAAFSPTNVSPIIWFDVTSAQVFADTGGTTPITNGTAIARVNGQYSTPNFLQATLGARPTWVSGTNPEANFDNLAVRYLLPAAEMSVGDTNGQRWIAMAIKMNSNAVGQELFEWFGTANLGGLSIVSGNKLNFRSYFSSGSALNAPSASAIDTSQPIVIFAEVLSSGANLTMNLYVDGSVVATTTLGLAPDKGNSKPYVGADPLFSGDSMNAQLYGVAAGNGALSSGNRASVITALGAMAGRTL